MSQDQYNSTLEMIHLSLNQNRGNKLLEIFIKGLMDYYEGMEAENE